MNRGKKEGRRKMKMEYRNNENQEKICKYAQVF